MCQLVFARAAKRLGGGGAGATRSICPAGFLEGTDADDGARLEIPSRWYSPTPTPRPRSATPTPTRRPRSATPTPTRRPRSATPTPTPRPRRATPTPTPRPRSATPTGQPSQPSAGGGFSWERDALTSTERETLAYLQEIEMVSPALSDVVLGLQWLSDGVSEVEKEYLFEIKEMAALQTGRARAIVLTEAPTPAAIAAMKKARESRRATPSTTPPSRAIAQPTPAPAPMGEPIQEAAAFFSGYLMWVTHFNNATKVVSVYDPFDTLDESILKLSTRNKTSWL